MKNFYSNLKTCFLSSSCRMNFASGRAQVDIGILNEKGLPFLEYFTDKSILKNTVN